MDQMQHFQQVQDRTDNYKATGTTESMFFLSDVK